MTLFLGTTCPACGGEARMRLDPTKTSPSGAMVTPVWLGCPLCTLQLNTSEEIAASGADFEKAKLPSQFSLSWGPTLPFTYKLGETYAG